MKSATHLLVAKAYPFYSDILSLQLDLFFPRLWLGRREWLFSTKVLVFALLKLLPSLLKAVWQLDSSGMADTNLLFFEKSSFSFYYLGGK